MINLFATDITHFRFTSYKIRNKLTFENHNLNGFISTNMGKYKIRSFTTS